MADNDNDWVAQPSVDGNVNNRSSTTNGADGRDEIDRESRCNNDAGVAKNNLQVSVTTYVITTNEIWYDTLRYVFLTRWTAGEITRIITMFH